MHTTSGLPAGTTEITTSSGRPPSWSIVQTAVTMPRIRWSRSCTHTRARSVSSLPLFRLGLDTSIVAAQAAEILKNWWFLLRSLNHKYTECVLPSTGILINKLHVWLMREVRSTSKYHTYVFLLQSALSNVWWDTACLRQQQCGITAVYCCCVQRNFP